MASITDALERIKHDPRGPIDPAVSEMRLPRAGPGVANTPLSPPNTLALGDRHVKEGRPGPPSHAYRRDTTAFHRMHEAPSFSTDALLYLVVFFSLAALADSRKR